MKSNSMEKILSDYKKESDNVELFIEEEGYENSFEELIKISDLHSYYKEYCFKSNYTPVSNRLFTKRIRNMGIKVDRKSYGMVAYLNNKF